MTAMLAPIAPNTLPSHGHITCRRCFTTDGNTQMIGKWQMVNDPTAWGSTTPEILVLGFSKGFTQANAFRSGRLEDIPFKNMRTRLTEELRLLGVIGATETVDQKIAAAETKFAFGSLVRCSLSRFNAKDKLGCTGEVMPKAFTEEISSKVRKCAETFLSNLPASVRLVLMLGTTDSYIDGCRSIIRSLHGAHFSDINAVGYRTGDVVWIHISHPSGLNGHHPAWMTGDAATKPGRKRHLALDAIQLSSVAMH
jgi:hypothetical protein